MDPWRGKNRSRRSPSTKTLDWKAAATNQMLSNDLEACQKRFLLDLVPFLTQIFDAFLTCFWT